ncbi:hypothetical protein F511_08851 [Dorcoceras hygrometricum]|uniref:RRP15-like protein n=1 Tax=Dorcoceras hygrometricum TaxID=472368 RepID=A0A2Z7ANU0_9LAMI|nr:hypothetical protein F511_08851 [Dorcoceras hygrometricum]
MAAVIDSPIEVKNGRTRRKPGKSKGKLAKKRLRNMPDGAEKRVKIDYKMKKLFQKRARDYNSDEDGEDEARINNFNQGDENFECEDDDLGVEEANEVSEDEDGGIQPGVTKFTEGIKAFKLAFKKIVAKKNGDDSDVLGPVLSAHKKLLGEKLAEEEAERKAKGEANKEKHLKGEKGHVKPANYLDAQEKFLLGVATKGVVKLFNAVNKAQNAQKGLNPSRTRDEKIMRKRRKEAFFSELGKTSSQSAQVGKSSGSLDEETPAWAPLRDDYMLTNPRLKDWDKMQDTNVADDFGRQSATDSSDDD